MQTLGLDHQRLDAIVIPRALDGPQQIGEDDFAWLLVPLSICLSSCTVGSVWVRCSTSTPERLRVSAPSMGCLGSPLADAEDNDQHDEKKQQVDQHQAGKVEQAPEAAKEPSQTF